MIIRAIRVFISAFLRKVFEMRERRVLGLPLFWVL